jgi:predicted DNA-binding transcriptional regulator YafY
MKKTERHFKIITYLQGRRRAVTAQQIAEACEVNVRTIYRDVQEMMTSGVPISGEAGVGYILDKGYHLPPLSFDIEEIEALVLGMAMVSNWTDAKMGRSAQSALDKIKRALPTPSLEALYGSALFSYRSAQYVPWSVDFSEIRSAIRERQRLHLMYEDEKGKASKRTIRPLAMAFFGPVWLVLGWCELREDFRNFRLDRIQDMIIDPTPFEDEDGKRLRDYCDGGFVDKLRQ